MDFDLHIHHLFAIFKSENNTCNFFLKKKMSYNFASWTDWCFFSTLGTIIWAECCTIASNRKWSHQWIPSVINIKSWILWSGAYHRWKRTCLPLNVIRIGTAFIITCIWYRITIQVKICTRIIVLRTFSNINNYVNSHSGWIDHVLLTYILE